MTFARQLFKNMKTLLTHKNLNKSSAPVSPYLTYQVEFHDKHVERSHGKDILEALLPFRDRLLLIFSIYQV